MADELAYVTFSGIDTDLIEAGGFTYQHGALPSVGYIIAREQRRPPAHYGEFTIHHGRTRIVLPGCALDNGAIENSGNGPVVRYRVLDRRWRWKFYRISGAYNLYDNPGGSLRKSTEKTPRELAALLLNKMKETGYDTSQMPNTARPTVSWEFTNAGEALEDLCERVGCFIVYDYTTNKIRIEPKGVGAALPERPDISAGGLVIDPPEMPGQVEFIGGPDEFQWDFELEAVGKELNGEIKLLDDLSYKPAAGWKRLDIDGSWNNLGDTKVVELARQWVYRAYRIKFNANNELDLPDLKTLNSKQHVFLREPKSLELLDKQLQTVAVGGIPVARHPIVYGIYYPGHDDLAHMNNVADDVTNVKPLDEDSDAEHHKHAAVRVGFSIDHENLIVHFSQRVYKYEVPVAEGTSIEPAKLRLRIAFRARDPDDNAYEHYREYGNAGGPPELTATIGDPNIVRRVYPVFNEEGFTVSRLVDNATDFTTQAQPIIQAKIVEMQGSTPSQITYETILLIRPDGAIQQVSWTIGGGAPTTTGWRNNEVLSPVPSYRERRAAAKLAGIANNNPSNAVIAANGRLLWAPSVFD